MAAQYTKTVTADIDALTTRELDTLERLSHYFTNVARDEFARYGTQLAEVATTANNNFANAVLVLARNLYARRFSGKDAEMVETVTEGATAPERTQPNTVRELKAWVSGQTFTVVLSDETYATIQFDTPETGKLAGNTIVRYLNGPDNETDFKGCAFVTPLGVAKVWKSQSENPKALRAVAAANIVLSASNTLEYSEAYAMRSGRCAKCNRKLTVPTSLHRGYGPDCWDNLFGKGE